MCWYCGHSYEQDSPDSPGAYNWEDKETGHSNAGLQQGGDKKSTPVVARSGTPKPALGGVKD